MTQARIGVRVWLCATAAGALGGVAAGSEWYVAAGAITAEPAVGIKGRVGVGIARGVGSGVPDINSRTAAAWSTSFHAVDMVALG